MNTKTMLFIALGLGAVIGISVGGFLQKVKMSYDKDLVTYENLAVTPVASPVAAKVIAPTPEPTDEETNEAILAASRQMDVAVHAKDFIYMPTIKTSYGGYPVEFLLPSPGKLTKKIKDSYKDYFRFYHIEEGRDPMPWNKDYTRVNGFFRASVFGDQPLSIFEKLHTPFYGIYVIYDEKILDEYPTQWIYCVWSMKRKAPIPFSYPSKALAFMKRQQGKR